MAATRASKASKLAYLSKFVAHVCVTCAGLSTPPASPRNIAAGVEPLATNELLQLACVEARQGRWRGMDNAAAVRATHALFEPTTRPETASPTKAEALAPRRPRTPERRAKRPGPPSGTVDRGSGRDSPRGAGLKAATSPIRATYRPSSARRRRLMEAGVRPHTAGPRMSAKDAVSVVDSRRAASLLGLVPIAEGGGAGEGSPSSTPRSGGKHLRAHRGARVSPIGEGAASAAAAAAVERVVVTSAAAMLFEDSSDDGDDAWELEPDRHTATPQRAGPQRAEPQQAKDSEGKAADIGRRAPRTPERGRHVTVSPIDVAGFVADGRGGLAVGSDGDGDGVSTSAAATASRAALQSLVAAGNDAARGRRRRARRVAPPAPGVSSAVGLVRPSTAGPAIGRRPVHSHPLQLPVATHGGGGAAAGAVSVARPTSASRRSPRDVVGVGVGVGAVDSGEGSVVHSEMTGALLDIMGRSFAERRAALLTAAETGDLRGVGAALGDGEDAKEAIDPDESTGLNAFTALHHASARGHTKVVQRLLGAGSSVAAVTSAGETPLLLAAYAGHTVVCELLLDAGADVAAANEYGETALHSACRRGHAATARLLMQRGADAAQTDRFGDTAADCAPTGDAAVAEALSTPALPRSSLQRLPYSVCVAVLRACGPRELGRMSTTCGRWRRIVETAGPALWRAVGVESRWQLSMAATMGFGTTLVARLSRPPSGRRLGAAASAGNKTPRAASTTPALVLPRPGSGGGAGGSASGLGGLGGSAAVGGGIGFTDSGAVFRRAGSSRGSSRGSGGRSARAGSFGSLASDEADSGAERKAAERK